MHVSSHIVLAQFSMVESEVRLDPNYMPHFKHDSLFFCNLCLDLSDTMQSVSKPATTTLHRVWSVLTDWERFLFASEKGFDVVRFARTYTRANAIDCNVICRGCRRNQHRMFPLRQEIMLIASATFTHCIAINGVCTRVCPCKAYNVKSLF